MRSRDNLLIVEGKDDLRIVPELVERAGVSWGPRGAEVVRIYEIDGYTNLAAQFRSQLKNAGLLRLGIIVDADLDPMGRWRSIRDTLASEAVLPTAPPSLGFITNDTVSKKRLGVWMMPDNATRGMMETFLLALRPESNPGLLAHVESSVDFAQSDHAATFLSAHRDKALIHTWLAWQDPPGRQMHDAVKQAMFDATLPYAAPFIAWFKDLYELSRGAAGETIERSERVPER